MLLFRVFGFKPYLERSKMYHTVNIWVLLKNGIERSVFRNINLEEFRSLSANELNTVDCFL